MISKPVPYGSPLHKTIVDAVDRRWRLSRDRMSDRYTAYSKAEDQALLYVPSREVEEQRKANKKKGKPEFTTIEIPFSYAQMLAAHTYWSSVLLGRSPIFQFSGRHGQTEDAVRALEAVIDYQTQVGNAILPYYYWLHDVGKYGLGVLGTYWAEETYTVSEIKEVEQSFLGVNIFGTKKKQRVTSTVAGYKGNKVFNVRPQDWFPDPRVPISQFQKGEFCARYVEVGWNEIKKKEAAGEYFNVDVLAKTAPTKWRVDSGSPRLQRPNENNINLNGPGSAGEKNSSFLGYVELLEMHVELIPRDWGLGPQQLPEKWVFTLGNGTVLIGCRPFGMFHNQYPFDLLEYELEPYGLFKRSMLELLQPLNDTLSWLFNSHFYNVRKILNDQIVFDPSRIAAADLESTAAGRLIRMKPAGYGSDARTALHQLQVMDVTQTHIQVDSKIVMDLMARVSGVNDNSMGLMNTGGRKSATEVRAANTYSAGRLKTNVEVFSAQGFQPHAMKLVQNTQQLYTGEQSFRIAGNLLQTAQQFIQVTPDLIAGFFDYMPVDGNLPVDRQAQALVFTQLMDRMMQFPEIALQYDVNSMFGYVAWLAGVKNLEQFKVKVTPDEQLNQAVRAGNLVAARGGNPGAQPGGAAGKPSGTP